MKGLSLFSGMGGDTLGMKQAGVDVVIYSEWKKTFQKTHEENFPDSKLIGDDIRTIKDETFQKYKGDIDIIFAGFPCQGFSHAGKKDPEDERNNLFRHFIRSVKCIQPKYAIGENVVGLLTKKTQDNVLYIDAIRYAFREIGYNMIYKVYEATDVGVPQKRKRLIMVAMKDDIPDELPAFSQETTPNLRSIIKFDPNGCVEVPEFDFTKLPSECVLIGENINEDVNAHPYLISKIGGGEYKDKKWDCLYSFGKRDSPIHLEIIDIRSPAKTVICTYGHQPRMVVPQKVGNKYYVRSMTPDELKIIQGFPSDYILHGNQSDKVTQVGNAVPPLLVKDIVCWLINKHG